MRAVVLSCTLKPSPAPSNTEALASVVTDALRSHGVESEVIRLADRDIPPGVESDMGAGDDVILFQHLLADLDHAGGRVHPSISRATISSSRPRITRADGEPHTAQQSIWTDSTGRSAAQSGQ